jgi:ribosomal protein L29
MEYAIKLKTVDIKSLSRTELEAAYIRLLKVSLMKTKLIESMGNLMNPGKRSARPTPIEGIIHMQKFKVIKGGINET